MMIKNRELLGGSFRDPSGFLFTYEEVLYRQVNQIYKQDYDLLFASGLYEKLAEKRLLVSHTEADVEAADPETVYKVIQPKRLPFISHPYEWCFSQIKDAALTTLRIQKIALRHGMSLKDASAYNIQFHQGKPLLVDTLSFETYRDGEPWTAYRQFCQHFLAPLALMAKRDVRLSQLLRVYIDGIPLDLASRLLPPSSRLNLGLLTHIHLHARAHIRYAGKDVKSAHKNRRMSRESLLALIEHLEGTVKKLEWNPAGTEWAEYYSITNYSNAAFDHKKEIIAQWMKRTSASSVWDLGANNGEFSRIASQLEIPTTAFDIDPAAVEKNYRKIKQNKETNLLPLLLDLTNPSPALGWDNQERTSLLERGPAEMVFSLALIHHLAISNNVPLERIAKFMSRVTSKWLIIEFVPKSDSQVKKLLANRQDIFDHYDQHEFERSFNLFFTIQEKSAIRESDRTVYLMKNESA